MIGQKNNSDMFEITLNLELHELCKAASIGGYFICPNDIVDHHEAMEVSHDIALITHLFAKIGIERSLAANYEQIYRAHYPEDVYELPMSMSCEGHACWGEFLRGETSW